MNIRKGLSAAGIVGRCGAILALLLIAQLAAADIGDTTVTFTPSGVGVLGTPTYVWGPDEINHDPTTGGSQALAVDLGADVVWAEVLISTLRSTGNEVGAQRERGFWQAFDGYGLEVGNGEFDGTTLEGYSGDVGTLVIENVGNFRYLVFTALPYLTPLPNESDSSDYHVRGIRVGYPDLSTASFGGLNAGQAGWVGVGLYGFDNGSEFTEGGRFIGAAPAPIVVNDQECSTGQGTNNQSCKIQFTQELTTTIAGEDVEGIIKVAGISTVVDFRSGCGYSGSPPGQKLPGASKPIEEINGALDLGFALDPLHSDVTGPIVPSHLCGIPPTRGASNGEFVLVNLDSDIVISRSVIEHEVKNDPHIDTGYECATGAAVLKDANPSERRSRLPVFGWLPKTSNPEIPVLDAYRELVPVLEDVTTGCGSTRSGASRLSFLVYDLHHAPAADYRSIIRDEILQLQATVNETPVCVDSSQAENLKSRVRLTLNGYDNNRLSYAKKELGGLLSLVQSKRLDREFAKCAFDLDSWMVTPVNPTDQDLVPRNFRGDLIVQIRHIQYMMDRMLGVTSP